MIDDMMCSIGENHRSLKALLSEKTMVIGKIQTKMDMKAYTKTPLNEKQITTFSAFTATYTSESCILRDKLKRINEQLSRCATRNECLHNDKELGMLLACQSEAIYSLHRIIKSGEKTLNEL